MTEVFNFWWLGHLRGAPRQRPLPLLKRVSSYIRQHPPAKPVHAPVPFTRLGDGSFCYLLADRRGLVVVCYDLAGKEVKQELIEDFFEPLSLRKKARFGREALESFHELLARYVFPAD